MTTNDNEAAIPVGVLLRSKYWVNFDWHPD
jgi:hypothetical protein